MKHPNLDDESSLATDTIISAFKRDGHTCIRGLATPDEIKTYKPFIHETTLRGAHEKRPIHERDTYGQAFLQVHNLWQRSEACKKFVFAKRFAHIAASLLGVAGVRLYHDQALFKEAGGGYTPWHQDQSYWPLEAGTAITMWLSLDDISSEVGSMRFVSGSHRKGNINAGVISDKSHEKIQEWIDKENHPVKTYGEMGAGDATFHAGLTIHSAGPNPSNDIRRVITVIYVADGTRILDPTPMQEFDLKLWLGGKKPGDKVESSINPLLYP